MNVVFLGTPHPAALALETLIQADLAPALVITRPDRPVGRGRRPAAPPVKTLAVEHGLPVFQPETVRDAAFASRIEQAVPDVLAVVAYGRILPPRVLHVAPHGAVNLHFSLLPRYRGAAPVQWALARGERVTGVSTIRMNERMDEGDLLLEREVSIEPGEHAPRLTERLARIGAELLVETLRRVTNGSVEPRPQDDRLATSAPMLKREDGQVDPHLPAGEIEGRIRGFDPWPGVWLARGGERIRLAHGQVVAGVEASEPPGTLVELAGDRIGMVCGGGTMLALSEVQPEGRRVMTVRDALNGRKLRLGERLAPIVAAR